MKFENNQKKEGIILMISSFNQLYNFLSFFHQKKLINNKKIYLTIFSDQIPEKLISQMRQYIAKFADVEIVDMRRKSIKFKTKFFKYFSYYFFVLKKLFQIKKSLTIPFILISGRMQIPVLCFMSFLSSSKLFFMEDGIGEYVPWGKRQKPFLFFYLLNKFLKMNKSRIRVLQLAKSRKDYFKILKQPFLKKEYYYDNRELYKNFIKNKLENQLSFKPKCIIIGTNPVLNNSISETRNFDYLKNLYIETLSEVNKRYSFSPDQILFFPHPRTKLLYHDNFVKSLSNYSNIHSISSIIVEHYLNQENLEIVIGSQSSALYYAKTIFNKEHVYYLDSEMELLKDEQYKNLLNTFEAAGIKKFFN